jgi:hypothetical protein
MATLNKRWDMTNRNRNFLWASVLGVIVLGLLLLIETPIQESHQTKTAPSAAQINTITPLPQRSVTTVPGVTSTSTINPTATSTPEPAWVADFANPILAAIKDREPDFQDDFSTDTKRWYPVSLGELDFDKTLVIKEGMMHLEKAWGISNYYFLNKPNIVMQVEVMHPINRVTICSSYFLRYINSSDGFALTLYPGGYWEARNGTNSYPYQKSKMGEQSTEVIMIVYQSQVAFVIDGIPVAYDDDPLLLDEKNDDKRLFECNECAIDNVKVWNLDKIPDVP